MLTAIRFVGTGTYPTHRYWWYRCDCGAEIVLRKDTVRDPANMQCRKCSGFVDDDLSGQTFGDWLVLQYAKDGRWLCRCKCGIEKLVSRSGLISNITGSTHRSSSCHACAAKRNGIKSRTHGLRHTRAYKSWAQMKQRCTNPNTPKWEYYGGAGVTFCERWAKFENFYADMGERPEGTSLDRYPNPHGNYEPGNCRWASKSQQGQNQTATKLTREIVFEILKSALTPLELAERFNVSRAMIYDIRNGRKWKDVYEEFHNSTQILKQE